MLYFHFIHSLHFILTFIASFKHDLIQRLDLNFKYAVNLSLWIITVSWSIEWNKSELFQRKFSLRI